MGVEDDFGVVLLVMLGGGVTKVVGGDRCHINPKPYQTTVHIITLHHITSHHDICHIACYSSCLLSDSTQKDLVVDLLTVKPLKM